MNVKDITLAWPGAYPGQQATWNTGFSPHVPIAIDSAGIFTKFRHVVGGSLNPDFHESTILSVAVVTHDR